MSLKTDILKNTQYYLSEQRNKKNGDPRVNEKDLQDLYEEIIQKLTNEDDLFSELSTSFLTQKKYLGKNKKKRLIKQTSDIADDILSICVKHSIDRAFKINFPNRNRICKVLFNILPSVVQMRDFTIVRFDFRDYFNSVNSIYVFEKLIKSQILRRDELDLIRHYVNKTHWAFCGLRPSNSIAEIIALQFDNVLKTKLSSLGLIYYERYIDDGLLILNRFIQESEIRRIISDSLQDVFYDKTITCLNRVRLNEKKFDYFSSRKYISKKISFLGYLFTFIPTKVKGKKCHKFDITYGISEEKRLKYIDRLKKLILPYYTPEASSNNEYQNLVLLTHRIRCFSTRQVYVLRHLKSYTWKSKGLIANYGELRYLADKGSLDSDTKKFLLTAIEQAFTQLGKHPPSNITKEFNLLENLQKNKTLVFVKGIGYNRKDLNRLCKAIGITSKSYDGLVRDYLIKMKVGY